MTSDEIGAKQLGWLAAVWHLVPMIVSFILGGMWTVGHGHHVFIDHPVGVIMGLG